MVALRNDRQTEITLLSVPNRHGERGAEINRFFTVTFHNYH